MRVVLAEHVADDRRGLLVRPPWNEARVEHRVEHSPMHRLESVAHIWQRARHDHAHRIVDERLFDLFVDQARKDPFAVVRSSHLYRRVTVGNWPRAREWTRVGDSNGGGFRGLWNLPENRANSNAGLLS